MLDVLLSRNDLALRFAKCNIDTPMTHQEKMRLATAAKVSLNTVRKWLLGGTITEANREAIERAVRKLGFQPVKCAS